MSYNTKTLYVDLEDWRALHGEWPKTWELDEAEYNHWANTYKANVIDGELVLWNTKMLIKPSVSWSFDDGLKVKYS